ncbi:MAG: hypothetical protein JNM63_01610 [Spirochaetia bacterium]|nr:hypothetical protein [Spirochaetia bacterium]
MSAVIRIPIEYEDGQVFFKKKKGLPRGHALGELVLRGKSELGKPKASVKKAFDFSTLPAFGMWKDRKDIGNSVDFVNAVRRKIESKQL